MVVCKMKSLLVLLLFSLSWAAVTKKDRVVDHSLSDKEPGTPDYDHDAFLGKDEAEEFKKLTPEESRRRLGIIVDKIDKNQDGSVTADELEKWIVYSQSRYIVEDSKKQFFTHDKNKDNKVHWTEYKEVTYGFLNDEDLSNNEGDSSYKRMIDRDERRWKAADENKDGYCDQKEFQAFLHPEEYDHMKSVVTKETIEDMDKNGDGFVSLEEYIGDMYNPEENEKEPDWIETEREQFAQYRDLNKDGKLDEDEVRSWILPDDYNHAEAEAKHLVYEADDNKDDVLSKDEIIRHHDKFVSSQATDFGEALKRHEEF